MKKIVFIVLLIAHTAYASNNQTDTVSPVLVNSSLPFKVSIESAGFMVPGGIHSAASGQNGYQYLFITGRTNGLHGFGSVDDFPVSKQNKTIFVLDICKKRVYHRSLDDPRSGLNQSQIDTLSAVSPQSYQSGNTLYITGGYGIDSATNTFSTKDTLTAINISGLIHWVTNSACSCRASDYIRQISDPVFQVTGGDMFQFGQCPTLLVFGQNFIGNYTPSSNGLYTQQIRRFDIIDDGTCLGVKVREATTPDPNYRRRDLNIIPIIETDCCKKKPALVALSGVFTLDTGIWTVPVEITASGTPSMADPDLDTTFKQAMNNYVSAHVELLAKNGDMYSILFGGLTFGFFENGTFTTDPGIPFTNQVTAIQRSKKGTYTQHLLPTEYPTITSTQSNPGKTLLFGAGAKFIIAPNLPVFSNGVLNLAKIKKQTTIGYIVGGIQSTLPNTNGPSDSAASPHIFKVKLTPVCC